VPFGVSGAFWELLGCLDHEGDPPCGREPLRRHGLPSLKVGYILPDGFGKFTPIETTKKHVRAEPLRRHGLPGGPGALRFGYVLPDRLGTFPPIETSP